MTNPPQVPEPVQLPEVPTPKLRRTPDLKMPPPPAWIGKGWLPRREITVLVGEEGIGKSLLWVHIAAKITTGAAFKPFGIPARTPADVVVIVTEDSSAEVAARLAAAGADMGRIIWFSTDDDGTGSPVFADGIYGDFARLDEQLTNLDDPPALIVVDAWLDTVSTGMNVRDTQQARAALHPWKTFANRRDLAVLLITHTNRLDTTNTRDLMGSTAALRQKARMVLFAARPRIDEGDEQVLYVGPDKSNSTGLVNAVRFRVEIEQVREQTDDDTGTVARLSRASYTPSTIRNLLGEWKQAELDANRKPTKADQAAEALTDFMAGRDEVPSVEVKQHLRDLGFGQRAAETAMHDLGSSRPSGQRGQWIFSLDTTAETSQSSQCSQSPQIWDTTANTDEIQTSHPSPISVNSTNTAKSANTDHPADDPDEHPDVACEVCGRTITGRWAHYNGTIHPGCKTAAQKSA